MQFSWKRYLKYLIPIGLMLFAIWGMAEYKQQWEMSRSQKVEVYFWAFGVLFWTALAFLIISGLFKIWKDYQQLKNEHNQALLALLKSKIDPHFFFNTLNNLYGLAIDQSPQTPQVILRLSEIMHYTIYDGASQEVALSKEIAYLKKYIEIHRIRYHKQVDIHFEEEVDNPSEGIAPLMFIILLENAFKHGVERLTHAAYIHIRLRASLGRISFEIENSFDPEIDTKRGIGLANLEKRLQLIYPKKHQLHYQADGDIFRASLEIQTR